MRRERPIFSSSSTISKRLEAIGSNGQQHTKSSAAQFSFHEFDITARQQSALARDGKTEAHAPLLKRNGGLEEGGARLFAEPRSGIVHFDRDAAVPLGSDAQDAPTNAGGLGGVFEEIGEDAFDEILIGDDVRDGIGQAAVVGYLRVGGAEEGDALLKQGIDVQLASRDGRLGGELGKSADAAFEGFDLIDHNPGGLFDESAVGFVVAGHHLFDGEADGGEGILDLVGHLAGEGLPTGELAEVDEALGALLELVGHMVEGLDGAADFVVARGGDAGGEVAGGQSGKAGGQLLDGAADAVSHVDQQGQGSEPEGGGEEDVGEPEAAAEVALLGGVDQIAGHADFALEALSSDSAEGCGIGPDFVAVADQVEQVVALIAGRDEAFGLSGFGEGADGIGPGGTEGRGVFDGLGAAVLDLLFEVVAGAMVELLAGAEEGLGQGVYFGRGTNQAGGLEQGRGEPDGGGERREGGREKDQHELVAEAVHPIFPRPGVRTRSARRSGPAGMVHCGSSVPGWRLKNSMKKFLILMPESPRTWERSLRGTVLMSRSSQKGRSGGNPETLMARLSMHQASAAEAGRTTVRGVGSGIVTENLASFSDQIS